MSKTPTFVDDLLNGDAMVYDFDDYVDRWHDLPDDEEVPQIHDFLGVTFEEYGVVCRDASAWRFVAAARREGISLPELMESQAQYGLAARAQDPESAKAVLDLLTAAGIYSEPD